MANKKKKYEDKKTEENKIRNDKVNSIEEEVDIEESGATCLSIEETNKLRDKLGLAPLEIGDNNENEKSEFVHVPAKNITEEESNIRFKEKLQLMKEQRQLREKLKSVKKFNDNNDIDDTYTWINKLRNNKTNTKKYHNDQQPSSIINENHDLTVEHDQREFQVGQETILTLKDIDILNDNNDDDKLENINLIEHRKARENIKNRTKVSNYNPYDEYDEETGELKPSELLSKYNDEIYGKQQPTFKIGTKTSQIVQDYNNNSLFLESVKHINKQDLNTKILLNRDYYTPQEYETKFKKPSGKKRTRIRSTVTMENDINLEPISTQSNLQTNPDEDDVELQKALEKARNTKIITRINDINKVLEESIKSEHSQQNETVPFKSSLVIDSVSEFVRSHDSNIKEPIMKPHIVQQDNNGHESKLTLSPKKDNSQNLHTIFNEDMPLTKGVGSALLLLSKRGLLEGSVKKELNIQTNIPKINASVDREKMRSIHQGKPYNKDTQQPQFDFDLSYYDSKGQLLSSKDAFRELSYKFHGKKPSKKKLVKQAKSYIKKTHEDSTDTVNIMINKQKKNQTPFLVLTGSNMNLLNDQKNQK